MKNERTVIAILAGAQFSHIMDFMVMMPLGPQLMRLFGISTQSFGLVVSVYTFSAALSCIAAAVVMDRFERKHVLVTVYAGLLGGTFLCGLAPTFAALLGARVVTGIFGGLMQAVILSYLGDVIPPERRGRATGIVMAAFSVASVIGVPAGLWIAERLGWQAVFLILALFTAGNWVLAWRLLPPTGAHRLGRAAAPGRPGGRLDGLRAPLRRRNTWLAMSVILTMMTLFSLFPFLPAFLVDVVGVRETELSTVYLVSGLCSFFVTPLAGRLADAFGVKKILVVSTALAVPATIALVDLGPSALWHAILLNTLVAAVGASRMAPAMTLINDAAVPAERGAFMTVTAAVQQLGAASWSYAGGWILAGNLAQRFPALGWLAVGGMVVSTLLALWIKPVG